MALIVRKDLTLSSGKLAVQCSHAAVQCSLMVKKHHPRIFERWMNHGSRKICLAIENLSLLSSLKDRARESGLMVYLVKDAGRTELPAGTVTVLGIGPAPRSVIDLLTENLHPY